jgi:uncharacterized protein involved in outer membrane biogenesis
MDTPVTPPTVEQNPRPGWRADIPARLRHWRDAAWTGFRRIHWPLLGKILGGFVAAVFFLLFLTTLIDWNTMRGPVSRMLSGALGRAVTIQGPLNVDLFRWRPRAEARDLIIGNPDWAVQAAQLQGPNVAVGRFALETRWLGLLVGDTTLTRVELDRPVINLFRAADGRATWNFGGPTKSDKPFNLPAIRLFMLRDGQLTLRDDQRNLNLQAALTSTETADAARPFMVVGRGEINKEPFELNAAGASLLNVRRDRPYAFNADIKAGATHVLISGRMIRPFDFGLINAKLNVAGADLSQLYPLTGVTLPNTPPYELNGDMARNRARFEFNNITGRVGDTDLRGKLAVDRVANRPMLTADLRSKQLDFDDLATVLGAPPAVGRGETASAAQTAEAKQMAATRRILPDAKLNVERVRNMDARVNYAADTVSTSMLPLRRASVTVTLDKGVLSLSPLAFSLPRGDISGRVTIDARPNVPAVDLDIRLANARVEDFLAKKGMTNVVEGALRARAQLHGSGASVHDAASHANGQVTFVAPRGEIREAFAELLGINVTRGLGLLFSKDQSTIPVRCGVANFRARNGVMTAENIVFDTQTVLTEGSGTVNLGTETLDLRLRGNPKEARLVRVIAPITVKGPLRSPQLGVEKGGAVGQAGLAAALGTLLSPLAAILPFVDAGLADDADCSALMAEAKQRGAPGNLPTTTAPSKKD